VTTLQSGVPGAVVSVAQVLVLWAFSDDKSLEGVAASVSDTAEVA
jgi:hypothetical protein